jgi:hypothetical protein
MNPHDTSSLTGDNAAEVLKSFLAAIKHNFTLRYEVKKVFMTGVTPPLHLSGYTNIAENVSYFPFFKLPTCPPLITSLSGFCPKRWRTTKGSACSILMNWHIMPMAIWSAQIKIRRQFLIPIVVPLTHSKEVFIMTVMPVTTILANIRKLLINSVDKSAEGICRIIGESTEARSRY